MTKAFAATRRAFGFSRRIVGSKRFALTVHLGILVTHLVLIMLAIGNWQQVREYCETGAFACVASEALHSLLAGE